MRTRTTLTSPAITEGVAKAWAVEDAAEGYSVIGEAGCYWAEGGVDTAKALLNRGLALPTQEEVEAYVDFPSIIIPIDEGDGIGFAYLRYRRIDGEFVRTESAGLGLDNERASYF